MRRLLRDPTAVVLWLGVTLVGVVVAFVAGHAGWVVAGWAVGGIAAVVLVTNGPAERAGGVVSSFAGPPVTRTIMLTSPERPLLPVPGRIPERLTTLFAARRRSPLIAAAGAAVALLLLTVTQTASAAPGGRHQAQPTKVAEKGIYLFCQETPGRSPGYYCRQIGSLPPGVQIPVPTTTVPATVTTAPTSTTSTLTTRTTVAPVTVTDPQTTRTSTRADVVTTIQAPAEAAASDDD